MRYVTEDDFDEAWEYFHSNKEWFPHVRKFHVRNRLKWGQVIIQDNVIITQQQYKRTGPIGRHTINFGNEPRNVITQKGDYIMADDDEINIMKEATYEDGSPVEESFGFIDSGFTDSTFADDAPDQPIFILT